MPILSATHELALKIVNRFYHRVRIQFNTKPHQTCGTSGLGFPRSMPRTGRWVEVGVVDFNYDVVAAVDLLSLAMPVGVVRRPHHPGRSVDSGMAWIAAGPSLTARDEGGKVMHFPSLATVVQIHDGSGSRRASHGVKTAEFPHFASASNLNHRTAGITTG